MEGFGHQLGRVAWQPVLMSPPLDLIKIMSNLDHLLLLAWTKEDKPCTSLNRSKCPFLPRRLSPPLLFCMACHHFYPMKCIYCCQFHLLIQGRALAIPIILKFQL